VGGFGRLKAIGIGAAALALSVAAGPRAFASSSSVVLADGSTLAVWEQRGRAVPGRSQESSSLGYSVTNVSGMHLGTVSVTADAGRDEAPFLAVDETGAAVLVWSRFDGSYRKIAYARFSGGSWTNAHDLTYGPGNDDQPRLGVTEIGSFLFFVRQPDRYEYAPIDLVAGRLFAAPRLLNLGSARREIEPLRAPGSISMQGAVDAPITGATPPDKHPGGGNSAQLLQPGQTTIQAAVDVPVANNRNKAIVWGVGSSGGCRGLSLAIPARDLHSAFLFRFTNGVTGLLQQVSLPGQLTEGFGASLAAAYLPLACD
jgi:hypothetical protein